MRFFLSFFIILALAMQLSSCSPVQFSGGDKDSVGGVPCDVSNPCVGPNGLKRVNQQVKFTSTNKVDVLVIADNSGSMSVEQGNLGAPFNGFISNLSNSGMDWQVAVTNTDVCPSSDGGAKYCPGESGLPGAQGTFMGPPGSQPTYGNQFIIRPGTSNADQVFNSYVQRGNEVGSGDERAIFAANLAIDKRAGANAGFFRSDSNFSIVILADEDERSANGRKTDESGATIRDYAPLSDYDLPQTLMNKVATTWGGQKSLLVNAIVVKPGDSACLNQQRNQPPKYTAQYGYGYADLATKTGGVVASICDNGQGAFANELRNITGAIARQPQTRIITLNYIPASKPKLTFNPASNAVNFNWSAGSNKLELVTRPADGTSVTVSYDYDPTKQ